MVSVAPPGRVGQYLALTGARLNGADLHALGLATHYIASDRSKRKAQIVAEPRRLATILDEAATAPPAAAVTGASRGHRPAVRVGPVRGHSAALEEDGGDWAPTQRALLAQKSPQSCKVSLRLLHEGAAKTDFADEMRMEYGVAAHVCQRPDFAEGVRALLIDKDNAPAWSPPTPEAVTDHAIDTIFPAHDADPPGSSPSRL
jgi:enoyl-CoA hydratase